MDQATIIPLRPEESIPNELLTLDQAREKILALLSQPEANAWEIGNLLNTIEKRRLPRTKGYKKTRTWLEAEVPEAVKKKSALYCYAGVAAYYTKEQAERWRMTNLHRLMLHDCATEGEPVPGDPTDRDIQLLQEDGSTLVKKFRDCTCRELHQSTQRRRKARKGPDQAPADVPTKRQSRRRSFVTPQVRVRTFKNPLPILGLGVLMVISQYLQTRLLSTWNLVLGTALILTSVGMLIRQWRVRRKGHTTFAETAPSQRRSRPIDRKAILEQLQMVLDGARPSLRTRATGPLSIPVQHSATGVGQTNSSRNLDIGS